MCITTIPDGRAGGRPAGGNGIKANSAFKLSLTWSLAELGKMFNIGHCSCFAACVHYKNHPGKDKCLKVEMMWVVMLYLLTMMAIVEHLSPLLPFNNKSIQFGVKYRFNKA